jgi:hypothetical protein
MTFYFLKHKTIIEQHLILIGQMLKSYNGNIVLVSRIVKLNLLTRKSTDKNTT